MKFRSCFAGAKGSFRCRDKCVGERINAGDDAPMMTSGEVRRLALELAGIATNGTRADWALGLQTLERLDGRSWQQLDKVTRTFTHTFGGPRSGGPDWMSKAAEDPTGFVAVLTSFHVDGFYRERAIQLLTDTHSPACTAALSVRLIDHVPEVRSAAWDALEVRLDLETAPAVFDVVLANRDRRQTASALARVESSLLRIATPDRLIAKLTATGRDEARRWAFTFGRSTGVLTVDDLVTAALGPDQWIRVQAADSLMSAGSYHRLEPLLTARFADARIAALARVPDPNLADDKLLALLSDPSPRVRELAQWRARRRGLDAAVHYRHLLADLERAPRVRAASLEGLAIVGDKSDLPTSSALLKDESGRVRVAAVNAVLSHANPTDAVALLVPALLDVVPKVTSAAARALARLRVPSSAAEAAWSSAQSSSRRAAWQVSRANGGWDRVAADLRAAADSDADLAAHGRDGVITWLANGAASTWAQLPDHQRSMIEELLPMARLGAETDRILAFHASIALPAAIEPPHREALSPKGSAESDTAEMRIGGTNRRRWWWPFGRT